MKPPKGAIGNYHYDNWKEVAKTKKVYLVAFHATSAELYVAHFGGNKNNRVLKSRPVGQYYNIQYDWVFTNFWNAYAYWLRDPVQEHEEAC